MPLWLWSGRNWPCQNATVVPKGSTLRLRGGQFLQPLCPWNGLKSNKSGFRIAPAVQTLSYSCRSSFTFGSITPLSVTHCFKASGVGSPFWRLFFTG